MNLSLEELPPALRQDFSLPNGTALLQQLDTIDNAACGWIQFMSKVGWESPTAPPPRGIFGPAPILAALQVSVDIFKGFPDEESIVNYTLNQAYQDNVTVFASEFLSLLPQGPLSPTDLCSHQLNSSLSLLCPILFQFLGLYLVPRSTSSHVSTFS